MESDEDGSTDTPSSAEVDCIFGSMASYLSIWLARLVLMVGRLEWSWWCRCSRCVCDCGRMCVDHDTTLQPRTTLYQYVLSAKYYSLYS